MKTSNTQKSVTVQVLRLALAIVAIFAIHIASAQQVITSSYVEYSHVSSKLGYSVGYQFGDTHIEVGAFQQNSMNNPSTEVGAPADYEQKFAGVYMNYPIVQGNALSLSFKIRTGVSNGENFVITPAVNGDYKLYKKVQITGGLGVRAFRPTLVSGIKIII
jgi:hypothetical protein